ncbi:hypothetical protein Bbelb_017020 [Branchiostoma belcheri]|nr:hypothetical protein Bbelb_017020 [Branchiostoma belcheri]
MHLKFYGVSACSQIRRIPYGGADSFSPTPGLVKPLADQSWLKPLSHIQNLPPNTSQPRLAEASVTHSEPSPELQPTKNANLPPNSSRPRLAEAPCHTFRTFPPNTIRPRLAEVREQSDSECKEAIYIRALQPSLNRDGGRHRLSATYDPLLTESQHRYLSVNFDIAESLRRLPAAVLEQIAMSLSCAMLNNG